MGEMTVSISGLNNFDKLQMGAPPGVRFEEIPVPRGSQGELTLLTAYFLMTSLTTLSAYLLRKHEGQSFTDVVVITHPDGTREERHITWKSDSTEAPEAAILRQIRGSTI